MRITPVKNNFINTRAHQHTTMKLLEFPHSHYCEKAKWALDHKGLAYKTVPIIPGLHMITVRYYAPDTSVPVLLDHKTVVQGSSEIINYLEQHFPQHSLTPVEPEERQACLQLETAMDKELGENIRRILYHRLLAYPTFVRYCFTHPMAAYKQWLFTLSYPILRYKIYHNYVISDQAAKLALHEFDEAMQTLARQLENRQYFIGNKFSRCDLTVASMLAFIFMPRQHPFPWIEIPDPEVRAFYARYQNHPVIVWANNIYLKHRQR